MFLAKEKSKTEKVGGMGGGRVGRRMDGASDGALSLPIHLPLCSAAIFAGSATWNCNQKSNDKILQRKVEAVKGRRGEKRRLHQFQYSSFFPNSKDIKKNLFNCLNLPKWGSRFGYDLSQ